MENHVLAVHEKLKPYKCDTCEKSFARKGDLKAHIRDIHQKLKSAMIKD